jgi:uncharacterized protein YecE (DUF72 family)
LPDADLSRRGLAHYSAIPLFGTVGVDRSYYRSLRTSEWASYRAQVTTGFRFLIKAPGTLTRPFVDGRANPGFLDPRWAQEDFLEPALAGLGAQIGPVVLQFTPGLCRQQDRETFNRALERFLSAEWDPRIRWALELRDPAWFDASFLDCLAAQGASPVWTEHPAMDPLPARWARLGHRLSGPFIARWNLQRPLHYETAKARFRPFDRLQAPDPATRAGLATAVRETLMRGETAWVTINNKAEGSAPASVLHLAQAIGDPNR